MPSDFWILRPFNTLFWIMSGAVLLLLLLASLLLRKKSECVRKTVLVAACVLTAVGFFVYKVYLSLDAEYNVVYAAMGGFNWWGELPLHLCNINMLLIPVAVLTGSRPLKGFCFFVAPLGALMALLMPGTGFSGYSLLLPRMLGYHGTHCMVLLEGLALASFGLYRPRFRDLPGVVLMILAIAFGIFLIDMAIRLSGLNPKANYFFAVETEGNALLELFYRLIPFPFLYLLPCTGILVPYMLLITLPFAIADRKREKSAA